MSNPKKVTTPTPSWPSSGEVSKDGLTFARRGEQVNDTTVAGDVSGYDAEHMRARSLLTAEEEKKLMRRVDWRQVSTRGQTP
ncbi:Pantothenate transporter [Colletotrichum higginsianum IMI 349063]|uniref:Pantothenate transporter n=1 Tax=Colletotrichum higginsianum (strain IMI 349063) TaxID=759273 RepID=A0A1B7YMZ0_COLHI|nr:Pantothenate transporter [Colletotrichum higginsianum IMI 349063]OBR13312.1 Pantothenate transporter [Colletotrichum higginsianum IMI 349063]